MTKLLFISDSERQRLGDNKLPAIARFDDERYKILREGMQVVQHLQVVIISTKYGVIEPSREISAYRPAKFDPEAVDRYYPVLARQWTALRRTLPIMGMDDLMIAAVDGYRYALQRLYVAIDIIPKMRNVIYGLDNRGQQAQQLKDWLYS